MNTIHKIAILIFACLLISCQTKQTNDDRTVFRYNESAGIFSLDPAFAKDQAVIWACNQMFNGLVQLDNDLHVQPCIAKRWEISPDLKTYVFHLRNDVYFHRNKCFENRTRLVTASDFVYSFNRIVDSKTASPGLWVFDFVEQINGKYAFEAIDDTTFQIRLREAFPPFLGILSMQYCAVVPHEAVEMYTHDFRKNPVGTGPFYMKTWKEGVKLVMLKNENYFETENGERLPYLDAVAITFVVDKQSSFLEFMKGNLDFISGIDGSYKDELLTRTGELKAKHADKIRLDKHPYLNAEYIGFAMGNDKQNPLHNRKIRQAVAYGFDREKMIRYLRNGIGIPARNGMIPAGMPGFDTNVWGYSYNPEKAKQLLAEAGFPNGKNMPAVTITASPTYADVCKFIQQQMGEIGIKLEVEITPPATVREMMAQFKVPMFRGSWIADYADAENYMQLFLEKNFSPKGANYTHYSNSEFEKLYKKAKQEADEYKRAEIYKQMDKLMMQDVPVIPVYYDVVTRFVSKDVQDLQNNALNLLTLKNVKKQRL